MVQRPPGVTSATVVCEIAFRLALPDVRAEVRRLMKDDTQYDFFRDACIFPDHPRKRPSEHFVNLARTSTGLTSSACPVAGNCVLSAIDADSALLASYTDDAKKLESLKFLGHWVGDLHQPLHVSFEDDRGGNSITVNGACAGNLHSAWDTCLVLKAVDADPAVAATDLLKDISPTTQEQWTQALDPKDWQTKVSKSPDQQPRIIVSSRLAHAICLQEMSSLMMLISKQVAR